MGASPHGEVWRRYDMNLCIERDNALIIDCVNCVMRYREKDFFASVLFVIVFDCLMTHCSI